MGAMPWLLRIAWLGLNLEAGRFLPAEGKMANPVHIWFLYGPPDWLDWDILGQLTHFYSLTGLFSTNLQGAAPVQGSWYVICCFHIRSHLERQKPLDPLLTHLPSRFPVAVLMERSSLTNNRWIDHQWKAVAVTVDSAQPAPADLRQVVYREPGVLQEIHRGFEIVLKNDECELLPTCSRRNPLLCHRHPR